jgi:hypothetical protein
MMVMAGNAHLLQMVLALHTIGGFAHFLYGRQEQADQHSDDGDDHE